MFILPVQLFYSTPHRVKARPGHRARQIGPILLTAAAAVQCTVLPLSCLVSLTYA